MTRKFIVGRIVQVFKGRDNIIRTLNLRLPDNWLFKRNDRDISNEFLLFS